MDSVLSLIRMVDIFHTPPLLDPNPPIKHGELVPPGMPLVSACVVANVKADVGYAGTHVFEMKLLNTADEFIGISGGPSEHTFESRYPGAPAAIGFITLLNVGVRRYGTCYVCLFLDNVEIARTPITLAPISSLDAPTE